MARIVFDHDEYLASLQPPAITLGGVEYVGRILSIEEWWTFEAALQRYEQVADATAGIRALRTLMHRMFDAIFPGPRWLPGFDSFAARRLKRLPLAGQLEAFQGFIACLARAHSLRQAPPAPETKEQETPAAPPSPT